MQERDWRLTSVPAHCGGSVFHFRGCGPGGGSASRGSQPQKMLHVIDKHHDRSFALAALPRTKNIANLDHATGCVSEPAIQPGSYSRTAPAPHLELPCGEPRRIPSSDRKPSRAHRVAALAKCARATGNQQTEKTPVAGAAAFGFAACHRKIGAIPHGCNQLRCYFRRMLQIGVDHAQQIATSSLPAAHHSRRQSALVHAAQSNNMRIHGGQIGGNLPGSVRTVVVHNDDLVGIPRPRRQSPA